MKKAATAKVFSEKDLKPDNRPISMSVHIHTARTTDASKPTTKANIHKAVMMKTPFSHLKRPLANGRNNTSISNQMMPTCIPDKASTCDMPATE